MISFNFFIWMTFWIPMQIYWKARLNLIKIFRCLSFNCAHTSFCNLTSPLYNFSTIVLKLKLQHDNCDLEGLFWHTMWIHFSCIDGIEWKIRQTADALLVASRFTNCDSFKTLTSFTGFVINEKERFFVTLGACLILSPSFVSSSGLRVVLASLSAIT